MRPLLIIGYKNYSSWSLRPWLALRWGGIPFDERLVRLDQPGYGRQEIPELKAITPNGTVPALVIDGVTLWDSLAIAEWAAEQVAPGVLWPADAILRGQARSVTSEMHSGFPGIRRDLSMNIHRRCATMPDLPDDTRRNLARVIEMWTWARERHAGRGPYLFGERSIADAFYAPIATRLRTYAIPLDGPALAYRDLLLSDPDFLAWEADSVGDSWDIHGYSIIDGLYPGNRLDTPD